jgi:uncharacterized protein (TIGR02646 family)
MRPIRRAASPRPNDFNDYKNAKADLISRIGSYCSYCERRIATILAVEHIQPKGLPAYEHLSGCWENFLLGCVNCNATKKDKDVQLNAILLPDRDNTFAAFVYSADGKVAPMPGLSAKLRKIADDTLALTGLDKKISVFQDENGKQIAIDRVSQRMQTWAIAEEARNEILASPENISVRRLAVKLALAEGFFSIWMTIFEADVDIRNRLIDAFNGTRNSGCFDPGTSDPVSPAPNPDGLPYGSKL